jgi:polar amino acid transport system substrate-binding protein
LYGKTVAGITCPVIFSFLIRSIHRYGKGAGMFFDLRFGPQALQTWRTALSLGLLALTMAGPCAMAKELRIVTIDSAPFGFATKDGKPSGMMYEISNLIAKEAGFTSTNQILPYPRTVLVVANGDADFVLRYGDAKLASVAIPVAQVLSLPTIVVSKPSFKFRTLNDLHGKTVGHTRGGLYDDDFEADTAILRTEVSDYSQMLKMLMADRFEAGIGSSVGLYYNAHLLGLKKEQLGPPLVLSTRHFELHFSKKTANEETLSALRDAVARLKKRNEIKKIVDRYMSTFEWDLTSK